MTKVELLQFMRSNSLAVQASVSASNAPQAAVVGIVVTDNLVVIRTTALNHLIHHRGQLSVYLRLLNIPLPSVYGPTADEAVS
jgi:hypothetical protein